MRSGLFIAFVISSLTTALAGTWRDDFSGGDLREWEMCKGVWMGDLMPGEGNWRVEGGAVVGGEETPSTWHALSVGKGWSWSNYTAEVRVKLENPLQVWAAVGLYISPRNGVSSGMEIRNDNGSVCVRGYVYSHPARFSPMGSQKPLEMETGRWYRLKISVDEVGNLRCFLDDQLVAQFWGYHEGAPGFFAYQVVAAFDDFVVTGPGIPDRRPTSGTILQDKLAATWGELKGR